MADGPLIFAAGADAGAALAPSPLSRVEIRQWEEDESVRFDPWERRAIIAIDRAWLASQAPKKEGG